MQDDVKAVERELNKLRDSQTPVLGGDEDRVEVDFQSLCNVLIHVPTLQERCERLEAAARAALPLVVGEEEASALELALTQHPDARSNEQ